MILHLGVMVRQAPTGARRPNRKARIRFEREEKDSRLPVVMHVSTYIGFKEIERQFLGAAAWPDSAHQERDNPHIGVSVVQIQRKFFGHSRT